MRKNVRGPVAASALTTFEGTPAMPLTDVQALRRTVASCLLWENEFYENGEAIADRVKRLTLAVPAADAAEIAREARTMFKLRHAPLWVARWLAAGTADQKAQVAALLGDIVQRPDELTEFLALYWTGGKMPLAASVKRGLAKALGKFDEYALAKYNRDGPIKLRDVLFLTHAKPIDAAKAELYQRLAENTLVTPDTWEVSLSAGKDKQATWVRLLAERKLGAMAILRNLRNMQTANVPPDMIREAIRTMKVERVLPFRFITAARYAPTMQSELEAAMYRCLEGTPKLAGRTAIIVDTSPSMWHTKVSAKSELDRFEAAAALTMLVREICDDVKVYAFNSRAYDIAPVRGFTLRDALAATQGGASCGNAAVIKANRDGYDRIIVFTDGEWHAYHEGQPTTHHTIAGPARDVIERPLTDKAYLINVASYRNAIGSAAWTMIDGWSEAVITYIQAIELIARGAPVTAESVAVEAGDRENDAVLM